eukprot:s7966_g1.t1
MEEPETPVIATASDSASKAVKSTPKVKPMPRPRKTINKRAAAKGKSEKAAVTEKPEKAAAKGKPAVKRMPRRIAVKQEVAESVRGRSGTFRARQTETNRKRRLAWKARQKEAAEFFKKARLEEEQCPADVIAVERSTRGREVQRRAFNPKTGKREIMNITLTDKSEGVNTKMLTSFRGFSKKPVSDLRCAHCGQLGHLISMCPQMSRRVSLTESAVVLTPRGYHEPAPTEVAADDSVRPEDSVSVVAAGLTAERPKAHERRLRGHAWDSPVAAGESSEAKTGAAMAAGYGPHAPKGRPSSEPRPPSYPPPTWRPPSSMLPPPPPIPAPLPPPSTPPPKREADAHWKGPWKGHRKSLWGSPFGSGKQAACEDPASRSPERDDREEFCRISKCRSC